MQDLDNATVEQFIYRRARRADFQDEPLERSVWLPDPKLFIISKQGDGLSVFRAELATPYRVLQHHINVCQDRLARENMDDKNKNRLLRMIEKCQEPGHMMSEEGWRVVRLPKSAFPTSKFTHGQVDLDDLHYGHYEITGDFADFETNALSVIGLCKVLTPEESKELSYSA